ncbi:Type I restriction-modification system, DNA-methyltransferase subunit M [Mariniradius saccharolyticus AK6]|uniref:site-specific DNA-methyltransferase (adenine-specific) n=1 Tax=Mariniradius saccharolyticus AK6 TaxID=1239962 RepID=M7XF43_9BACT|nr:type I restriction-modification system subunit M [Mariniradius saccharolyticus]EMS33168.1 Type I restriction-modification system, DNA-methyltransferase subunit M [Mariniradius saccharolyticus AK6]
MSKKITQKDINDAVWRACDTFRGSIDPSVYKDYVLTMLFVKYLSDVHDDKQDEYLKKYNGDQERAKRAMQYERFIVPEHSHFKYLYENRNAVNIGELIDIALVDLEEANREKLYSEDGAGIFKNISFNSSVLGEPKDKNTRLKNLLLDFNKPELDLRPSHLDGVDIIGGAYEYLISNFASDAGKKAGEFFTPSEVSTLLAKLTKSAPGSRICDPTCGSGSLLIKAGQEVGSPNFSLYGQEANGSTWALAVMNMFLHGFDNAKIRWGDTIRNPKLKEGDTLMKFDTVVANPPFSLDKWGKVEDKDGEKTTITWDPETDRYNRFWRGIPPKSKGDWAFISHMIETTYEGRGKVGVVVPHGVLFRGSSEGKIRQKTIEENLLEAVIGLPANLFFGTGIPAAILVFNKGKGSNSEVLFIDASQHYEAAKNQNKLRETDIKHIVDTYRDFQAGKFKPGVVEDKYSYVATFEEIKENDFNLNIPRYVDTFEEEPEVDIAAVQQEIDKLEAELKAVQAEMDRYLTELLKG